MSFHSLRIFQWLWLIAALWAAMLPAAAHEEPTSYLNGTFDAEGIQFTITASATDLAHDLPAVEPDSLLQPDTLAVQQIALKDILLQRLQISADGMPVVLQFAGAASEPEKKDIALQFRGRWDSAPKSLHIACRLFPYDTRHQTFLNLTGETGVRCTAVFSGADSSRTFDAGKSTPAAVVFGDFFGRGIHHIFIGPDHILFVVTLLLLGGSMGRLLKIVTAFTIAHSITLVLAALGILSPPASLVEPVIALSIVFTAAHALLGQGRRDPRQLFAFGFGLIHGFGFAFVLQEMTLPAAARGWSLLAFNLGVEAGQCAIVLAVAPVFALLRRWRPAFAERAVTATALGAAAMGALWFFQRVMPV